jgi:hypothetical protein
MKYETTLKKERVIFEVAVTIYYEKKSDRQWAIQSARNGITSWSCGDLYVPTSARLKKRKSK